MCIVFVCMRYVKKFGCHYNQSGVLKIEILILLRLARFQNLGTPPNIRDLNTKNFESRLPYELQCWVNTDFKGFVELSSLLINVERFGFFKIV